MDAWITQLRRGLIELCVLAALSHEEAYGYQIVERLGKVAGLEVTESTIYPLFLAPARLTDVSSRGRPPLRMDLRALLPAFRGWPSPARNNDRPLADFPKVGQPTRARRCPMTTLIVELSPSLQSIVDERLGRDRTRAVDVRRVARRATRNSR